MVIYGDSPILRLIFIPDNSATRYRNTYGTAINSI